MAGASTSDAQALTSTVNSWRAKKRSSAKGGSGGAPAT
jgi:hypothetical protein